MASIGLGIVQREFQDKRGAFASAFTVGRQLAAHFFGGAGSAVKPEAVTRLPGGESMREKTLHILWQEADAVIRNSQSDAILAIHCDAHGKPFIRLA